MDVESLAELHKHAFEEAIQVPCNIPDFILDTLHYQILEELKSKCSDFKTEGLLTLDEINALKYVVRPKIRTTERQYNFTDFPKVSDRYKNSIYDHCEVLEGRDITDVFEEMKDWLSDFGTEDDKFAVDTWGTRSNVGDVLEDVKSELQVDNLFPHILEREVYTSELREPSSSSLMWKALYYINISPVKMQFYFHDPIQVEGQIDIRKKKKQYRMNGHTFEVEMPELHAKNLKATTDAEIEYFVSKCVNTRTWGKMATIGIISAFDKKKSKTFTHKLKVKISCEHIKLELKGKLKLDIPLEKAQMTMEDHRQMTEDISDDKSTEVNMCGAEMIQPQWETWERFINTLRSGGEEAAMEMIKKNPKALTNLPANGNSVLGIGFEELQIAKVMAEAQRTGTPLILHKGDGRGTYEYRNQAQKTPVYADAVFQNTATDEYFVIQFKYSDKPENLVKSMSRWKQTHKHDQLQNLPPALELDNVQLIGPSDIADHQRFSKEIEVGSVKVKPDDLSEVKKFVNDNEEVLRVGTDEYRAHFEGPMKKITESIKKMEKRCSEQAGNIATKRQEIDRMRSQDPNANTRRFEKAVENMESQLNSNKANLEAKYKSKTDLDQKFKSKLKDDLISPTSNLSMKALAQDVALAASMGAVIDGVTTLIITSSDELTKYFDDEITLDECALEILKKTGASTVRGAAVAGTFGTLMAVVRYATAAGWRGAGVLSGASRIAGPAITSGLIYTQVRDIAQKYKRGVMTETQMKRQLAHSSTTTALSISAMAVPAVCLTAMPAMVVGGGLAIAVGVGDYFLGTKVWSSLIKDKTPDKTETLIEKKKL